MNKFLAIIQLIMSLFLGLAAIATLVNMVLIATRPETISVVNVIIGQGILIICFLVISRVLLTKGLAGLKQANRATGSDGGA
jgi:hypothetical protein